MHSNPADNALRFGGINLGDQIVGNGGHVVAIFPSSPATGAAAISARPEATLLDLDDVEALRDFLTLCLVQAGRESGRTVVAVRERTMAGRDTYKDWHTWTETTLVFADGEELTLGGDDTEVYDAFEYDHFDEDGNPVAKA